MATSNANAILRELAKFPSLDPRAVLAIASHEGLGGGIGDNGTSFGPFQLHYGGAYPSSAPQGASASQAWAWSPAGIDYALSHIAGVAGGLHGLPAIQAISSRFERPANVAAEVADAAQHYGAPLPHGAAVSSAPGSPAPSAEASRSSGLLQLLAQAIQSAHGAVFDTPQRSLLASLTPSAPPAASASIPTPISFSQGTPSLAALLGSPQYAAKGAR